MMKVLKNFLLKELSLPEEEVSSILGKFRILAEELKAYNKKVNLTSIVSDEEIEAKHFVDSLAVLKCGIKKGDSILDVGSGAGFPALPLAIVLMMGDKRTRINACEATGKKAAFISFIADKLHLDNLKVYPSRSEELPKELLGSFDWVLSRALAAPLSAFELMFPWARAVTGRCVLYTTPEIFIDKKISEALEELGGTSSWQKGETSDGETDSGVREYFYELPSAGSNIPSETIKRKLLIVPKIKSTPLRYPRRPGMAVKNPL